MHRLESVSLDLFNCGRTLWWGLYNEWSHQWRAKINSVSGAFSCLHLLCRHCL